MQLGRFTIEQLNEGRFELFRDGKINRMPVSSEKGTLPKSDNNSSLVGINPIYVTDGTHHVLLDAGLGWGLDAGSAYQDVSNLHSNLEIFEVQPADITHVILTHLHYDHAAGISYTDQDAATRPAFPNARYFVQQSEWAFALAQVQHQSIHSQFYKLDDMYRLYADSFFNFIDENESEIIPGISVIKTGGHTPGHQIVKITDEENTAYFMGDLVPTARQLNHFDVANLDMNRTQAKKMKVKLLRKAYSENALLYFYHSLSAKPGHLQKDKNEKYVIEEL